MKVLGLSGLGWDSFGFLVTLSVALGLRFFFKPATTNFLNLLNRFILLQVFQLWGLGLSFGIEMLNFGGFLVRKIVQMAIL